MAGRGRALRGEEEGVSIRPSVRPSARPLLHPSTPSIPPVPSISPLPSAPYAPFRAASPSVPSPRPSRRELFAEARKAAPSVVFIDELDAVGARRGMGFNEERDQTLNQLLTEMDGFEGREGVLVMAATNRPDALDPALLRPGRLTRRVTVPLPDERGRAAILMVHLRRVPLVGGTLREEAARALAAATPGLSGAELANSVNEAALLAGRAGLEHVTMELLSEGVARTRFGIEGGEGRTAAPGLPRWARDAIQRLASTPGGGRSRSGAGA